MESKLLVVFQNVNEWLRFAEAKNAMIIALNGVIIFGLAQIIDIDFLNKYLFIKWYLSIAFLLIIFSTVIALMSFIPRLKKLTPSFNFKQKSENFLFFNCLKDKQPSEILEVYNSNNEPIEPYHQHLAEQIITNAGITKRKYDYFTFASWLTVAGIVTPPLAIIYALYNYKNN